MTYTPIFLGMSNVGNTSGVTGTVSNQLVLAGGNNVTLSQSTSGGSATITISAAGGGGAAGTNTIGMSNLGNTVGTSGVVTGSNIQFAFAGGNNVTLSQSINASSATITISAAGGGFSAGMSTGGNTVGDTGVATNQIVFAGGNNITLSQSTAAGGNTITISGAAGGGAASVNFYQNMDRGTSASLATAHRTLMLQRLNQENAGNAANITANTFLINMTANMTATSLSSSHTLTLRIGIYADQTTQLSLINSASTTWGFTAGTSNSANYHGPRWMSFVSSQWSSAPVFVEGSVYVFGLLASTSNYGPPLSYIGQNYMHSAQRSGTIGTTVATNTSLAQGNYWNAMYSATVSALPVTISASQVNRNNATAIFMPHVILNNRYSGTF